jgi:hypothetical protein
VKPVDANGTRFPLPGPGCLAASLLAIALLCQPNPAAAADGKGASLTVSPVLRGDVDDRGAEPEVAPGGTLVLRGTRPVNPSPAPPNPGDRTQGAGVVTNGPAAPVGYAPGWDQRYDYSGLDWGPPGPVIGVVGR